MSISVPWWSSVCLLPKGLAALNNPNVSFFKKKGQRSNLRRDIKHRLQILGIFLKRGQHSRQLVIGKHQ